MNKLLPALVLGLLCHGAASADEREWFTYKTLIENARLEKFYAIPAAERDKLNLYVTVKPVNKAIKANQIVLTVLHKGAREVLPLAPNYRMALVPNAQWLAEDAKIMTSLPSSEKSALGWDITTPLPEGAQWSYAGLMASVAQSNAAIKKMAGAFSLFAPKIGVLVFKFAKPAKLTIQASAGALQYSSDAKGEIRLKPDAALSKENPVMQASERPFEVELDTE